LNRGGGIRTDAPDAGERSLDIDNGRYERRILRAIIQLPAKIPGAGVNRRRDDNNTGNARRRMIRRIGIVITVLIVACVVAAIVLVVVVGKP
jgi:hypothetical protein